MQFLVTSKRFQLIPRQWQSIAKGALVAGVAAALTYLTSGISPSTFGSGTYAPLLYIIYSVVINSVQKYVSKSQQIVTIPGGQVIGDSVVVPVTSEVVAAPLIPLDPDTTTPTLVP